MSRYSLYLLEAYSFTCIFRTFDWRNSGTAVRAGTQQLHLPTVPQSPPRVIKIFSSFCKKYLCYKYALSCNMYVLFQASSSHFNGGYDFDFGPIASSTSRNNRYNGGNRTDYDDDIFGLSGSRRGSWTDYSYDTNSYDREPTDQTPVLQRYLLCNNPVEMSVVKV